MVVLRMTNQQGELLPKVDNNDSNVHVGDRVQVGNHRATVKYVGPVPPTKGLWLGLDWDDPSRGKHDGQYSGTRYFQARYPTSGSLVRLEKVELGRSICDAIKDRYGGPGQVMSAEQLEEIRRALNTPFLEMVGLDRPEDDKETYRKLTVVGVSEYRVNSVGEPNELSRLSPIVKELDISRNLIAHWSVVSDIAAQLPYLRFLDVSENRLDYDINELETYRNSFKRLLILILSKMEYSWDDIVCCATMWPHIEKLQISYNRISVLNEPPADIFYNLKLLNIEGNNIRYWTELEKLGHLPRIIRFGIENRTQDWAVNMSEADKYQQWESISELSKLKSLEELKFRQNPILESVNRESARQLIIARIPALKILNLQDVEPEERRGAEIDYLKKYARDWIKTANDEEGRTVFLQLHPVYPDLVNRYGEVEIGEICDDTLTCLKSRLITINLVHNDSKLTKKVPDSMLISTLSSLALTRLLRGYPRNYQPTLTLVSSKEPNLKIPLTDCMKSLSYYSVEDGDTILTE